MVYVENKMTITCMILKYYILSIQILKNNIQLILLQSLYIILESLKYVYVLITYFKGHLNGLFYL